jgi:hypothetical protein
MLKITERNIPEIKYPVGRRRSYDDVVAIFWGECKCTVVCKGTSNTPLGYITGDSAFHVLISDWKPVDIKISAGQISIEGNTVTGDEVIYPVAMRNNKNNMIVILAEPNVGVIADPGNSEHMDREIGEKYHLCETSSVWTAVNLKIYG